MWSFLVFSIGSNDPAYRNEKVFDVTLVRML